MLPCGRTIRTFSLISDDSKTLMNLKYFDNAPVCFIENYIRAHNYFVVEKVERYLHANMK